MGFKLILYPLSVLFANAFASMKILHELRKTGTTVRLKKNLVNFDQFNEIVDLAKFKRMERNYISKI